MSKGTKVSLEQAKRIAAKVVSELRKEGHTGRIEICGSIRRNKPMVGDFDILVECPERNGRFDKRICDGMEGQVYYAALDSWGAFQLFLTGSGRYNIIMRAKAKRKGLKLNRYGLWVRDSNTRLAGETEQSIYDAMSITFKAPEGRSI